MTSEEKAKESLIRFEKQKSLQEKYKHLFANTFWGFEIPIGWDWIVEKYLEKTQWDVEKNGLKIQIDQIKEKFATLRIYSYPTANESLDEANIAYCEALADYTCEKCGCMSRDKQYTKGWIIGLCPTCYAEKEAEVQKELDEYCKKV